MNIEEAKLEIIKIKNEITYSNNSAVTPKKLKKIYEIIGYFNPKLLLDFKNNKKLSVKRHLLYCFLNDLNINKFTKYFEIDNNLNRIIEYKSLIDFSKIKFNNIKYEKLIAKYGLDITYPNIIKRSNLQIQKIIKRLKIKHTKCKACGKIIKILHSGQNCCNKLCQNKLSSLRMKISNPSIIHYYTRFTKENNEKMSNIIKEKIKNGTFTPNITNSWANSKVNLKFLNISFRSSWEAYFYIFMIQNNYNIKYEKIRIKYFDTIQNKFRIYITDFVDEDNNIIYEIKPECYFDSINFKDKEIYLIKWCKENNFTFKYITNEWFKENFSISYLNKYSKEENIIKILKCMKQFNKDKSENTKY